MIYVIGHKSPDLDSVVSAIAYANLKNKLSKTNDYQPAVAGEINIETKYILERFGFLVPENPGNLAGKQVVLVDHNENSQILDGGSEADIIGVLDHHKINFTCERPIEFKVLPWGSTNTIIAKEYFDKNISLDKNLAGIILAAILSDTVITKSPTCTEIDKEIIERLSEIAEIADWKNFGLEIFKIRSSASSLSDEAIIKYDFKDFDFKAGKFGIGQIETVDLNDFSQRETGLLLKLDEIKEKENYHSVIFFITDIINEGSKFLIASSNLSKVEEAFKTKAEDNKFYLPGVMSRKKQVIPSLSEIFDK